MHLNDVVEEESTLNNLIEINRDSNCNKNYRAQQYRILSITYAVIFCLVGIVLSTIEPFKACKKCEYDIKVYIEIFFIFMQTMSILWIIYMFILILFAKHQQKIAIKHPTGYKRRVSSTFKVSLFSSLMKKDEKCLDMKSLNKDLDKNHLNAKSSFSKFYFTYDYENGTGELYMRVGIAIFSLCSMIDRSLGFIQMAEAYFNNHSLIEKCKLIFVLSMLNKITSLLFIFMQTFFIFKYANLVINYGKNSAVLGLIHLVSTNFCVFFRTVIRETAEEIQHHSLIKHKNHTLHHNSSLDQMKHFGCINSKSFNTELSISIIEAEEKIGPYLYPGVIEYSLMCLTVFFILWSSIEPKYNESNGLEIEGKKSSITSYQNLSIVDRRHVNQFIIDCGKSTTGLFLGIFVLLLTLMTLIIYFIYKNGNTKLAVIVSEMTELFLVSLSLFVVILILIKFKTVKFNSKPIKMGYNETLTFLGLIGIYLFGFYSIIAVLENGFESNTEILSFSIQIASVVEATFQSVLIIKGLKMYSNDRFIKKNKPGRSLLTFLVLLDISLWLSETFSIKKYDMNTIQLDYYGIVFWSIVSSISAPLAIFFRFHASCCLSDMWKTLYE
ncbi:unnamed protein product [Brachionus calyciflorus]|uniref:Uncharacterized protein n=1 Tax=Brachionus calyciflorus TaxID=104777 RepID=A0A813RID9_9BILA|nr:unnamed protein product [Brachionus calyciflorus]